MSTPNGSWIGDGYCRTHVWFEDGELHLRQEGEYFGVVLSRDDVVELVKICTGWTDSLQKCTDLGEDS